MSLKSEIAPKGLQFRPADIIIGDKYTTVMSVISYPKFISPGFLADLTSIPGIKIVIKHIPVPFSVISKMLNKEIADLKQRYQDENDKTIQERIRQDYESLEYFIQQLASTQSAIYDFQMHVVVSADSEEALAIKKVQVKNYIESMEMRAVSTRTGI